MKNPIGLHENRDTWDAAVKGYGETVRARDPGVPQSAIDSFGHNMFGGDFVFSVSRDFVKACQYGNAVGAQRCVSSQIAVYKSLEETERQIAETYGA